MAYSLFRPILFALDPERAHHAAFAALDAQAALGLARPGAPMASRAPRPGAPLRAPQASWGCVEQSRRSQREPSLAPTGSIRRLETQRNAAGDPRWPRSRSPGLARPPAEAQTRRAAPRLPSIAPAGPRLARWRPGCSGNGDGQTTPARPRAGRPRAPKERPSIPQGAARLRRRSRQRCDNPDS